MGNSSGDHRIYLDLNMNTKLFIFKSKYEKFSGFPFLSRPE